MKEIHFGDLSQGLMALVVAAFILGLFNFLAIFFLIIKLT